jgi:aldehyde dehydrogenase (NAD+)
MHKQDESFFKACNVLAMKIEENRENLTNLLQKYETYETVQDELERSLEALAGFEKEFSTIKKPLSGLIVATFFPLNLPLYSLILFGVAPSRYAANVYIRPPEVMQPVLDALWDFLDIETDFANIKLKPTQRQAFMNLYAKDSDVIIFTGKYENALNIHEQCPYSLMVYNGSGVNPFVVFDNADVAKAVDKAIEMRCFNSGQDCAGPDAFIVHESIADDFVSKLKSKLPAIKVGNTSDKTVDVGPTMRSSYVEDIVHWNEKYRENIVYGGKIDTRNNFVSPTVVKRKLSEHHGDFHEFFAPYFYVLEYKNDDELLNLFKQTSFNERAMYVSIFGSNKKVVEALDFVKVLDNQIVNDVEKGNEEYGGWGPKANFLLLGKKKTVKPVLISRDIHEFLAE